MLIFKYLLLSSLFLWGIFSSHYLDKDSILFKGQLFMDTNDQNNLSPYVGLAENKFIFNFQAWIVQAWIVQGLSD